MVRRKHWLLALVASACLTSAYAQEVPPATPEPAGNATGSGKALSVFQVVKFPNTGCSGTSSYNGTCFTSTECAAKGGTSSGTCANGFGVCCVFTLGCGGTSSQNCTYFVSPTSPSAGFCGVTICKCSPDICALRMDFSSFVIAGPDTVTVTSLAMVNGAPVAGAKPAVTSATNCFTDSFSVTGGSGGTPPVICGTNTGQHMYVDASTACNQLNFELGNAGIGTTIPTRQWSIKVSQISCYDPNLPPSGCTQYYYGSTSGTVQSYNYANLYELANQQQNICIRRERNYCKICWSAAIKTDFAVSGTAAGAKNTASKCCGYGSKGTSTKVGYDCVMIPGAFKTTSKSKYYVNSFCGKSSGIGSKSGANKTVCSKQLPFQLNFITDAYTGGTATQGTNGFKLSYWETTC